MMTATKTYLRAVLHSYSMLFFSRHRGLAALLLLVTFGHPVAGATGLLSAGLAVGGARWAGFNREWTDGGAYGFNSLLVGLALASFYAPGWTMLGLVVVGTGLALLLSVALGGWLGGRGLPFLSLPFVLTTWLLLLGSGQLPHLLPAERGIYWLNDPSALGGPRLVGLAQWMSNWPWPPLLAKYLRALGAVVFQDSTLAGLVVALGLLWHSRIAFALSVLGFLGAYELLPLMGPAPPDGGTYNLGANYIVAAVAVGGVFCIPSAASYGWALGSVPVTVVLLTGLTAALGRLGLPALSLPYCCTALLFLYVLLLRERAGHGPVLTPVQHYSPEGNLYAYTTNRVRLNRQGAVALTLPFLGAWRCTQGYAEEGRGPTHLGDWGQALDFVIADADGRTYQGTGLALSDYYAYNKPVLAPADGTVTEVIQHLDDNAIGEVNRVQNWGNTVVLCHAPGLYSQLSHLRAHSVPVKVGEQVRRGDIIGTCGSSGRSPEPHLHFQVQAAPYVGSRTLAYPLAYFMAAAAENSSDAMHGGFTQREQALKSQAAVAAGPRVAPAPAVTPVAPASPPQLRHFSVPMVGETISAPAFNRTLSQALRFPPGYALDVRDANTPTAPPQRWEVFTDAYNLAYLRCERTGAMVYFSGDESVFYCTTFYGSSDSWLYLFYQAAYRVPLVSWPPPTTHDTFPLTMVRNPLLTWLQDLLAPFYQFLKPTFSLEWASDTATAWPGRVVHLRSRVAVSCFGHNYQEQPAELVFRDGALAELRGQRAGQPVQLVFSVTGA